ncbi:APH-domain-containing protein [Cucurbitaria berberidis CBS 394.84]|uniref:APH-domain-containing protein n=1 Tax=Cucurbitaria berberidis CBS 394.84 TaxID=1168544 RepID=A0A9P4GSG9_9PLEO|nr:APH-domain-containing protein [Cucurbitaria berberidis CBS 394.84]KAF1850920.1 APH-domain-containing protein [Cucurbitaria berberidis CBS 394.84]
MRETVTLFKYVWKISSKRTVATSDTRSPRTVSRTLRPGLSYSDDLFIYTRGRFVCDEKGEMLQRQVRFNVNELARCAAEAIGARSCVTIEKHPDGMYNKSMLCTMDNGSQVVAKVPNPNAGRQHYTTASEVATMDFARNNLGTPIPRVLSWSSKAQENPVGAEYIIMEKVAGTELEQFWPNMAIKDRFTIVKTIAGFQKAWTSVSFKKFGSLYYSNDLDATTEGEELYVDANGVGITDKKFAIGPSTGRESTDNGRATINFDRGPWRSLEAYHTAIGHREVACISQLPHLPKSPITLCGPGTYQPTRERKLRALDCYLKLIRFLLPTDPAISSAHLWHGDLHVANIFVDPSEPTKVVGLIDWQSTEISPLYFQARQPQIIDYDGPSVYGLERPQPPSNMERLEESAKKKAESLYLQQSLCSLYNTLTHGRNPRLYAALQFQQTTSYLLLLLARNLLIDGEASYLMQVAELDKTWDALPGAKDSIYPFSFSTKEREEIEAEVEGVVRGMEAMRLIRDSMGELFPEQGIVKPDQYEETLHALAQLKDQIIEKFANTEQEREVWQMMWPFGA